MKIVRILSVVLTAWAMSTAGSVPTAHAASQNSDTQLTILVPNTLSLSADTTDFALTFTGSTPNSLTDTKTVVYSVRANNMTKTTGVVSAKLDALFTDVDFKASAGTYTMLGGNARLIRNFHGFTTINTSGINLMSRQTVSGTGRTLLGTFAISYQAKAKKDLAADYWLGRSLSITLADI